MKRENAAAEYFKKRAERYARWVVYVALLAGFEFMVIMILVARVG